MKGFVPTPDPVVDLMVEKLFRGRPPTAGSRLLDPGCGRGAFVEGVIRWCRQNKTPLPHIVAVESDPKHVAVAAERFAAIRRVQIHHRDFLAPSSDRYDYVIGNPPYVPITDLTADERSAYRTRFATGRGRFDLYLLFFEQALGSLKPDGRLVFITPEKFLYVETAAPLRSLLHRFHVDELHFVDEQTFGELVTYPLISTVTATSSRRPTRVLHRDGRRSTVRLEDAAGSWLPAILGVAPENGDLTLADVCTRISCGVATGADAVFVVRDAQLDAGLRAFARPTIAGRQIAPGRALQPAHSMLLPYSANGRLLPEYKLGRLGRYLADPVRRSRLLARTCVARKPWYAFHETPPLSQVLRPKLLCKDITSAAFFVADRTGTIVPRHSVYYIVPSDPGRLDALAEYLNSRPAQSWLRDHCQRAANGFLRLQSRALKRLPLPPAFAGFRVQPADQRLELQLQPA